MAKILQENPLSNEAQSPLIAGLSEGISKLSEILDLKVGTFTDLQLSNIYISAEDKNRIYEAPDGKRLWLNSPEIVVKKNGTAITQSAGHFSTDYVGGSITFESGYTLNDSDIVTVSASYIVAESKTIDDIKSLLDDTNNLALRYKGFYANESSLTSALPNGVNGEFAFVLSPNFAFYAWDSASNTWKNTQSIEELSNFYTKTETDNLLKSKEPTITAKGATSNDDNYYWGGRKTWVDVFTKVRNAVLTGLSTTTKSAISATDTVLTALGKLQAQITELSNNKGDMSKSVYDKDLSGIVDDSEMLGGQLPSYYATAEAVSNAQNTADTALNNQKMEVLWENNNPRADFYTQTVYFDAKSYKLFLIMFVGDISGNSEAVTITMTDNSTVTVSSVIYGILIERNVNITGNSATFTRGLVQNSYKVLTENNGFLIPLKIIGILK